MFRYTFNVKFAITIILVMAGCALVFLYPQWQSDLKAADYGPPQGGPPGCPPWDEDCNDTPMPHPSPKGGPLGKGPPGNLPDPPRGGPGTIPPYPGGGFPPVPPPIFYK